MAVENGDTRNGATRNGVDLQVGTGYSLKAGRAGRVESCEERTTTPGSAAPFFGDLEMIADWVLADDGKGRYAGFTDGDYAILSLKKCSDVAPSPLDAAALTGGNSGYLTVVYARRERLLEVRIGEYHAIQDHMDDFGPIDETLPRIQNVDPTEAQFAVSHLMTWCLSRWPEWLNAAVAHESEKRGLVS